MEEINVRENLDEIYRRIDENCANVRPLVCKKDYIRPLNFEDPQISIIAAYSTADLIMSGMVTPQSDVTTYSAHLTHSLLIRYQMPTYFVSYDLCEALLKTSAPDDLVFNEIMWPMPVMRFMLPLDFSERYFGTQVPFITAALIPEHQTIRSHLVIRGGTVPDINVHNDKPFFLTTMLKWENNLPMNYDARCPIDRKVGDLLHTDLSHFHTTVSPTFSDPKDDVYTVNRLTNLSINILLAMTAEPELITPERMIRPSRKVGLKVVRRALWKPNFIGERFKVVYETVAPEGSHRSPQAHWRVGHWRNQRHGEKNTLVKRIWIKPVFVGLKAEHE